MQEKEQNSTSTGVWSALAAGFDLTAKHPWLLLLPILVDVFFWLGPRLRFQAIIEQLIVNLPAEVEVMDITQQLIEAGPLTNLFTIISLPLIGVPALLAGLTPEKAPLTAQIFDIDSGAEWIFYLFILSLIGLFLTAVYYVAVSVIVNKRAITTGNQPENNSWFARIGSSWLRLIGLAMLVFLVALLIYIPISIVGAVFFLLNATLGTIVLLLAPLILIWIVIYLSFAPPGIALNNRSLFQSVRESILLVQANLPAVFLMLLLILLLGALSDWLLLAAENGTWITLFNILIHAFVNTGFVTAFFILYQDRAAVLPDVERALNDGSI